MRRNLKEHEKEFQLLFGEGWESKKRGIEALLEATEWMKNVVIKDNIKPYNIDDQFNNVSRWALSSLGRAWGVQRQVVSSSYAVADRSIALGVNMWKQYAPEHAKKILARALVDPTVAEQLVMKFNWENMNKLKASYRMNIGSQLAQYGDDNATEPEQKP